MKATKKTPEILAEWEKTHGRCWVEEIQKIAESGQTWAYAGHRLEINSNRLSAFCHSRGLVFPWQGHRSSICREHQRRMSLEQVPEGRKPKRRKAFGRVRSLKDHAEAFGHTETTIRCRVKAGWNLEDALTTPKLSPQQAAVMGGRASAEKRYGKKKTKQPEDNRPAYAAHRVQLRADRTGAQRSPAHRQEDHQ